MAPVFPLPAAGYFRTEILRSWPTPDLVRIQHEGEDLGLFAPPTALEQLKRSLRVPEDFRPRLPGHVGSRLFLQRHLLEASFYRSREYVEATYILGDRRLREFLEVNCLLEAPEAVFLPHAEVTYRKTISPEVMKLYRRYFWSPSLTRTEWRTYVYYRLERLRERPMSGEGDSLSAAYRKSSYQDPYVLAVNAAPTPQGAIDALRAMGLKVSLRSIDTSALLEEGFALALCRVHQTLEANHPRDGQQVQQLTASAKMLSELKEAARDPSKATRDAIQRIAAKTRPHGIKKVHELTGGNHTTDLQKIPEKIVEPPTAAGGAK